MTEMNTLVQKIVNDHHIVLFTGVMFLISGMLQFFNTFIGGMLGLSLNLKYEFIILGIVNILMSFVFVVLGTQTIEKVKAPQTQLEMHPLEEKVMALEQRIAELELRLDGRS